MSKQSLLSRCSRDGVEDLAVEPSLPIILLATDLRLGSPLVRRGDRHGRQVGEKCRMPILDVQSHAQGMYCLAEAIGDILPMLYYYTN